MNSKKLSVLILSAIVAGLVVSGTNANMFSFDGDDNFRMEMKNNFDDNKGSFGRMGNTHFKKGINGNMKGLTDEEKTKLDTMTDEEKKAFFEAKRAEKQAEMEAKKAERQLHETIIDKLIDGETLTAEEEVIKEEIKVKRAERKALREQRQGKMEEFRSIMDKKIAGEELTEEEMLILKEFKGTMGKKGGCGCEGKGMNK